LIVESPVGLVGGDIKLEDSVIYFKPEGKPTGVTIEGNDEDEERKIRTSQVKGVVSNKKPTTHNNHGGFVGGVWAKRGYSPSWQRRKHRSRQISLGCWHGRECEG